MSKDLIIICILGILLWYYYMKTKDYEYKNIKLYNETNKLKNKNKYLQTYKTDVSNTFKILNKELVSINNIIKPPTTNEIQNTDISDPTLLTFLLDSISKQNTSEEPIQPIQDEISVLPDNLFTSFLNDFLTQRNTSTNLLPINQDNLPNNPPNSPLNNPEYIDENTTQNIIETTPDISNSVNFSVNYIPLQGNYSQYLIDKKNLDSNDIE